MHGEGGLQVAFAVMHGQGGLQVAVLLLDPHSLLLNQLYFLLLHSPDLLEQEVSPERVGLPLKLLLEVAAIKTFPLQKYQFHCSAYRINLSVLYNCI